MWMTVIEWILAITSLFLWAYSLSFLKHNEIRAWFDNKFGKDDPMPPMPNQASTTTSDKTTPSTELTKKS